MFNILDDNNVLEVFQSAKTNMIILYSDKLPNHENIMNVFKDFHEQFKGKINIYVCDYQSTIKVREIFKLQLLPGVVMLKNGKAYMNIAGPVSKLQYEEAIKKGIMQIMAESNN